jgi:hypothetical protein
MAVSGTAAPPVATAEFPVGATAGLPLMMPVFAMTRAALRAPTLALQETAEMEPGRGPPPETGAEADAV